jgi:predicted esterase YcpF (UPF0227 family)
MKKILYMYGFNSSPEESSTFKMLKELMAADPYCYDVISVKYDQTDPERGLEQLEEAVRREKPVAVIGSSLGGFFAMNLSTTVPVLVINPCLKPTVELPKLGGNGECYKDIEDRFYRSYYNNDFPVNHLEDVFGFFATNDELFSYATEFHELFSGRTYVGGHHPTKENLKAMRPEIHKQIVWPLHARKI